LISPKYVNILTHRKSFRIALDIENYLGLLYFTGFAENWVYAKKKTYGYRERDEEKRQEFIAHLSTLCLSKIVYLDESGMDNRDEYSYGWNQRGQRFPALKSGRREGRVNMIAAICNQKLIAPFTVEGACNRTVFETKVGNLFTSNSSTRTDCHHG
jgi:hypothetical protein